MDRQQARDWRNLALLWVVFGAFSSLVLVPWMIRSYPPVYALEGEVSDKAVFFLLYFAVTGFVLIVVSIVYMVWRFRASGEESRGVGGRVHPLYVGLWVTISALLNVTFVIYPGVYGLKEIAKSAAVKDPLVVEVTALQWGWKFSYPQLGLADQEELVLPRGKTAKIVVRSRDVLHSFWVPAFRIKVDAVPGTTNVLYITPTEEGSSEEDPRIRVQCAELCGVGHAWMRAPVRVVSEAEFLAWVKAQGGLPARALAREGE